MQISSDLGLGPDDGVRDLPGVGHEEGGEEERIHLLKTETLAWKGEGEGLS